MSSPTMSTSSTRSSRTSIPNSTMVRAPASLQPRRSGSPSRPPTSWRRSEFFVAEHCAGFDRSITADSSFDLQLFGIGRNGRSASTSQCHSLWPTPSRADPRLTELHPVTPVQRRPGVRRRTPRDPREEPDHGRGADPRRSVVLMLATGAHKADVDARALNGPSRPTCRCRCSSLGRPRSRGCLTSPPRPVFSDTMTRGDAPRLEGSSRCSLAGKKGPRHYGPTQ